MNIPQQHKSPTNAWGGFMSSLHADWSWPLLAFASSFKTKIGAASSLGLSFIIELIWINTLKDAWGWSGYKQAFNGFTFQMWDLTFAGLVMIGALILGGLVNVAQHGKASAPGGPFPLIVAVVPFMLITAVLPWWFVFFLVAAICVVVFLLRGIPLVRGLFPLVVPLLIALSVLLAMTAVLTSLSVNFALASEGSRYQGVVPWYIQGSPTPTLIPRATATARPLEEGVQPEALPTAGLTPGAMATQNARPPSPSPTPPICPKGQIWGGTRCWDSK